MTGSYNIWLVGLSIVVAMMASYSALDLVTRFRTAQGRAADLWLLGAAVSMGIGIWSMHFIGMLAFSLPIPLAYDVPITLGSIVPTVLAAVMALVIVRRHGTGRRALFASSCLLGFGIVGMHYTGMAALKMLPAIHYDPALFAASVVIAIAASWMALRLILMLSPAEPSTPPVWHRLAAAAVMGLAIAGMHYTGMAAAMFDPQSVCTAAPKGVNPTQLAIIVASATILIFLLTITVGALDAALHQRASTLAKAMVRDLEASRTHLATIVEHSNDAIISRTLDGTITSWNAAAERMFGYTAAEAIGQPITITLQPDRHSKIMEHSRLLLDGESLAPFEHLRITRDGRLIDVMSSVSPIRNEAGEIIGAAVIVRDISERTKTEENLRLAATVIENVQEGVMITDASNRIIAFNPAFTRITGYTAEEVIGASPSILSSGMQDQAFYQRMWAAINETGNWQGEIWDKRKNGELYCEWLSISAVKNSQGKITHHTAITTDITERKQAETARAQLAAIVESSHEAIVSRTFDGTITSWNAGAERMFGFSASDAIGKLISFNTPPGRVHIFPKMTERILSGETLKPHETQRLTKDGRVLDVLSSVSPIKNDAGEIIGIASLFHDITERKRAQEQVIALNAELEQRVAERTRQLEATNKELETFSYSVSHDLQAPLRGIDGFSKLLLKEYGDQLDTQGSDYLQRIRRATQRMGELIADLLQLSKVSRHQLSTQRVDLSQLASAILAELRESDPERIVATGIQEGVIVQGDPQLLRILLENLLGNSWKFTRKEPHPCIRFGTTGQDGQTVIWVNDNGAGFDMAYAHKLFGAFQRLHGATEFEGTGIGLATVQRIVALHGGRVWAEGAVDQGATFYFTLPPVPPSQVGQ